jgi:hypothetical protein
VSAAAVAAIVRASGSLTDDETLEAAAGLVDLMADEKLAELLRRVARERSAALEEAGLEVAS